MFLNNTASDCLVLLSQTYVLVCAIYAKKFAMLRQRSIFRIGVLVWRCLLGLASAYPQDLCCSTPGTRGRSSLGSMEQGFLFVPFARTSTSQARAFSVVGPSVWNGLPLAQRLLPRILSDTFYSSLKAVLFSRTRVGGASE